MLRQKEEQKWRKTETLLLVGSLRQKSAMIKHTQPKNGWVENPKGSPNKISHGTAPMHFLASTGCCWGFSQDPSVCASDAQLEGKHHECQDKTEVLWISYQFHKLCGYRISQIIYCSIEPILWSSLWFNEITKDCSLNLLTASSTRPSRVTPKSSHVPCVWQKFAFECHLETMKMKTQKQRNKNWFKL